MVQIAWTTPRTFVAAAVLTAAQLNENRDNWNAQFPLGAPAWTSYTPVLTQSGAVTKTVTYAKYTQIGKTVIVNFNLAVTGTGTGANNVTVSLPVTAASVNMDDVGVGRIFDTSASLNYGGIARISTTTTVGFSSTSTDNAGLLGSLVFTAGLASGDKVGGHLVYEAA